MTHICVSKLTTIGSDNGLSPSRRQAITRTNVGILLIGPLRTNFSEISIEIHTFSFKETHLKMSSCKWWPLCLGLNVLKPRRRKPRTQRGEVRGETEWRRLSREWNYHLPFIIVATRHYNVENTNNTYPDYYRHPGRCPSKYTKTVKDVDFPSILDNAIT